MCKPTGGPGDVRGKPTGDRDGTCSVRLVLPLPPPPPDAPSPPHQAQRGLCLSMDAPRGAITEYRVV